MAIGTENYPNSATVNAAYPYGGIKDNTGAGDGTPINKLTNDDIHQTFRKVLALAGITPNGNPDNVTNGFQYIDAFKKIYRNFAGVRNYPSNSTTTLTYSADINCLINIEGNTLDKSFNLPDSADCNDEDVITFYNNTSHIAIVQSGTDFVNGGADITLISQGDYLQLVLDKANTNWVPSFARIVPKSTAVAPVIVGSGGGAPAFQASWTNAVSVDVRFRRSDSGLVSLHGTAFKTGGATGIIFTLPVSCRPVNTIGITVQTLQGSTRELNTLVIESDGTIYLGSVPASADTYVFLEGIHFYQN